MNEQNTDEQKNLKARIFAALLITKGNYRHAAELLQMTYVEFWGLVQEHGMSELGDRLKRHFLMKAALRNLGMDKHTDD